MSHWKESRVAGLEHTTYFFGMVLDALKDNMPALAQARKTLEDWPAPTWDELAPVAEYLRRRSERIAR